MRSSQDFILASREIPYIQPISVLDENDLVLHEAAFWGAALC